MVQNSPKLVLSIGYSEGVWKVSTPFTFIVWFIYQRTSIEQPIASKIFPFSLDLSV